MMDILYLGIAVAFFLLTFGLMKACDVLRDDSPGDRS